MKNHKKLDYLVIGAGPSGLQMAYYLEKENFEYLVLEKSPGAGSFFKSFPRHRTLISINKVYTGQSDPEVDLRWDWNSLLCDDPEMTFKKYTKEYFPPADALVDYLQDFASKYELKVKYDTEVVNINKVGKYFEIRDTDGQVYQAKALLMATGIFKPYIPDIPGIELCENYVDCSVDPEDFINQRVLILGKGNSAFETADNLVGTASTIHISSPHSVKLAWQTHFVGNLRAINNNFLDTYQLKSQNAVLDADIDWIKKENGKFMVQFSYAHANNEVEQISYDRIIVSTGFQFEGSMFDESIKPQLSINDRFPAQTDEWESVNIPDLYFMGAISQQKDFKKYNSAFIHGFRYNARNLFYILRKKYHNIPLPSRTVLCDPESLTEAVMERINGNSDLWQQFGFMGDFISINHETGKALYHDGLVIDYCLNNDEWSKQHSFIMTMEFGKNAGGPDIFSQERIHKDDADVAEESNFLHPIIRHYYQGKQVSEFHMIEVLEGVWTDETAHINPLKEYIKKELSFILSPAPLG